MVAAADEVARAHQRGQEALVRRVLAAVLRLLGLMDRDALLASWRGGVDARVLAAVVAAQRESAQDGSAYVAAVLVASGVESRLAGRVAAEALAGVASDGRRLDSLLAVPVAQAVRDIAAGMSVAAAFGRMIRHMMMIVGTQVADAGRVAAGVAQAADVAVLGYERMVDLPACDRCIPLAGRLYPWSAGFERHPNCLPAGVVVSGPATLASTRRLYQGELVLISTSNGERLPITGNHPVLTDRGWLPAHLLQEGDHVVRSILPEGAVPLAIPHEHQVPTLIEDVGRPGEVVPLLQVPATAEDFHGDGMNGYVDVVLADRLLRGHDQAAFMQPSSHLGFALGIMAALGLTGQGAPFQGFEGLLGASYGGVGCDCLSAALLGGHGGGAHVARLGGVPAFHSGSLEVTGDDVAGRSIPDGQGVLAFAREIGVLDLIGGQRDLPARWDAPAGAFSAENRGAYAGRGVDLLHRLSGQIELDRVVQVDRVDFSGHVYNLTSSEGWYSANGLIVSNCDCVHRPVAGIEDWREAHPENFPSRIFDRLSRAEQDRIFGKAAAQAIRDGADIGQVVNARRGITTAAGPRGRRIPVTAEGTTRRGLAGRRLGGRTPRVMPEEIYAAAAGDREEAIRLLRAFGYIV